MLNSRKKYISLLVIIFSMLACSAPAKSTPSVIDPNAVNTLIVQTAQYALTLSAVPGQPLQTETFVPTLTALSTSTPTQTFTPTPNYTFTPVIPVLNVSVPTNCRSGPGKVYDYKAALLVGDTAEIFGRDPTNQYWYIRNPEKPDRYCWVWGEYATISGNVAFLPIFTPPPTPTATNTPLPTFTPTPAPDFQASYTSMDTCVGWWVELKLSNTGSYNFKSVEVQVTDNVTTTTVSNLTDGFVDINGCITSATKDTLATGTSTVISAPAFAYDPSGHELRVRITLCSKTGLSGTCITKKIEFTP